MMAVVIPIHLLFGLVGLALIWAVKLRYLIAVVLFLTTL